MPSLSFAKINCQHFTGHKQLNGKRDQNVRSTTKLKLLGKEEKEKVFGSLLFS
jgi:hypothetical protein